MPEYHRVRMNTCVSNVCLLEVCQKSEFTNLCWILFSLHKIVSYSICRKKILATMKILSAGIPKYCTLKRKRFLSKKKSFGFGCCFKHSSRSSDLCQGLNHQVHVKHELIDHHVN